MPKSVLQLPETGVVAVQGAGGFDQMENDKRRICLISLPAGLGKLPAIQMTIMTRPASSSLRPDTALAIVNHNYHAVFN